MFEDPPPEPEPTISNEEVRAYLQTKAAHRMLEAHVQKRVKRQDVPDLMQMVFMEATVAKARPTDANMLPGWMNGVANHVIARYYAKRTTRSFAEREFVERLEKTTARKTDVTDEKLMALWLMKAVETSEHDRETLDIIRDHVLNRRTYPEIAEERGLPTKTIENRVAHFKVKYAPLEKEYRTRLAMLVGLAVILLATVAYALYRVWTQLLFPMSITPPPPPAPVIETPPAPTASVFMPALPPTTVPAPTEPKEPPKTLPKR